MPLGHYAATTLLYNTLLGTLLWTVVRRNGSEAKECAPLCTRDLVQLGIATHKLARIITKDAVTAFMRAPFTQYKESLGYGEVQEMPRGKGARMVVGELLSCNYCASAWAGLGLFGLTVLTPRFGKMLNSFFSALAISDFLHVVYESQRTTTNVLTLREEKLERQEKSAVPVVTLAP